MSEESTLKINDSTDEGISESLSAYETLANNIDTIDEEQLTALIDEMEKVDPNGQILASAARYLQAVDPERFAGAIRRLVAATIDKDREHRYLPDLLTAIYGADYREHADQLILSDNNFRRIYKRLYPKTDSL